MHTNKLVNETSPYLLQHAHNPVEWYPWGSEALKKAKEEDKPIIVSIGYSACHWCHVMERECFEKDDLASLMNENFVSIKIDREERPDIDQIYMDAVQAMGIQGGWPLNVFLTPDARPFYGGTYFPPDSWAQILNNVAQAYKNNREELEESAEKFTEYLRTSHTQKYKLEPSERKFTVQGLNRIYSLLSANFDKELGGTNRAPKFPMPSVYLFLLRYYSISGNEGAIQQIKLTLDKMAAGGIYDQLGGGFARYSVDAEWFAPHFEKMLYDNAQLLSLYSEAYSLTGIARYREVVLETIDFLQRELTSPEGGFYSALDADSEGEEGKYYIWIKSEVDEILKNESGLFCKYYNVREDGNWEHNYNILHIATDKKQFAEKNDISSEALDARLIKWKNQLRQVRAKRIRPGLDDKILTSWNGLMLKGLADAYAVFHEPKILEMAIKNADFILSKLKEEKRLWHAYKYEKNSADKGKASILGYLEDYASVISGLLGLYQCTFEEKWVLEARALADYVIRHFYDEKEEMFFFTDDSAEKLIARKKEFFDNVIPASNSIMAINLYFLSIVFYEEEYLTISSKMLSRAEKLIVSEPSYLSNWASLYSYMAVPTMEIAIVGKDALKFKEEFDQYYIPNKVICGALTDSSLPLLEGRITEGDQTTIHVCFNKVCKRPVFSVEEALDQIRNFEMME